MLNRIYNNAMEEYLWFPIMPNVLWYCYSVQSTAGQSMEPKSSFISQTWSNIKQRLGLDFFMAWKSWTYQTVVTG